MLEALVLNLERGGSTDVWFGWPVAEAGLPEGLMRVGATFDAISYHLQALQFLNMRRDSGESQTEEDVIRS